MCNEISNYELAGELYGDRPCLEILPTIAELWTREACFCDSSVLALLGKSHKSYSDEERQKPSLKQCKIGGKVMKMY